MLRKLLSVVLTVMLTMTGFCSARTSHAQNDFHTVAILDLVANGIAETEAKSLSDFLRGQITRVTRSDRYKKKLGYSYKIIERSQMDKILDEMEFQSSGCTDEECAVEIGKVLNAEHIVIGSVGLVGKTYTIKLELSILNLQVLFRLQITCLPGSGIIY